MILRKNILAISLFTTLGLGFSACSDIDTDNAITDISVNENKNFEEDKKVTHVQEIFHTLPSPMEMSSLLKTSGSKYDASILNDINKVNDYTTSKSKALNLGIYGSDLSYASIFNQNQESIIYLSCAKKLADKLGVTTAFDNDIMERMEVNVENRDSLLNIISESYYVLDAYLKENGRDNISAMVIAGGWIEGLYLATTVANNSKYPEPKIKQRIAEQKLSLQDLLKLINTYNSDGSLDFALNDIKSLEELYNEVELKSTNTSIEENETGTTTVKGESSFIMSDETLLAISKRVNEIRNTYIQ